jgi:Leucine-rich repeat (LRR) protein
VRDNRLTALPGELGELRLTLLDCSNNDLRSLPPELGEAEPGRLLSSPPLSSPQPRSLAKQRVTMTQSSGGACCRARMRDS